MGCLGHPAPRAWAAGTSFAIARLVQAQAGWERGGRWGIQGLVLIPLLSLAEDAELVQCKCWAEGLAGGEGRKEGETAVKNGCGVSKPGVIPLLLLMCCVTLSELLNLSGPLSL